MGGGERMISTAPSELDDRPRVRRRIRWYELVLAVGLGWLALRFVTTPVVRRPVATPGLLGIAALAILRVVVFSAYQNHTVVETLAATRATTVLRTGSFHGIDHRAS